MQDNSQFMNEQERFATDLLQRAANPQTEDDRDLAALLDEADANNQNVQDEFLRKYVTAKIAFDSPEKEQGWSNNFLSEVSKRRKMGMDFGAIATLLPTFAKRQTVEHTPEKDSVEYMNQTFYTVHGGIPSRQKHAASARSPQEMRVTETPKPQQKQPFDVRAAKQSTLLRRTVAPQQAAAGKQVPGQQPQRGQPDLSQLLPQIAQQQATQQQQPQKKKKMGIFGKTMTIGTLVAGTATVAVGATVILTT